LSRSQGGEGDEQRQVERLITKQGTPRLDVFVVVELPQVIGRLRVRGACVGLAGDGCVRLGC